ncbi:MAG TPA: type I methionyl aminopeptidase [Kiritimatiellia bacterium]
MIIIKTPEEIERMRASGRVAAQVRDELAKKIAPGVTTGELDSFAQEVIAKLGAKSAFYGYRGYPGHICTSINDEVVHGIPGPRKIALGDLVSIDVGVFFDGYVGDTALSVLVAVTDSELIRLVRVAEKSLAAGIAKALPGGRLSDVSHAIESVVVEAGFSVVREFVGHGIGRSMHEDPQIPNFGPPGKGPKLKPGMTLAIEPMVNLGRADVEVMPDGWTVLTRDRKPSAHVEHTVAIGADGPEILTLSAVPVQSARGS